MADGGFDPAVSPLRVFGAMLRFYRTQAGLSQTDLGARVHFSGDLVSKIEMGQRIATEEFTAGCDGLPNLATGGALTELRGLMKEAIKNRALPGWFVDWPRKEAMARSLRTFELVAVPGLLQTEDYARAVLRTHVMATEEQVEDMVRARMERQSILTGPVRSRRRSTFWSMNPDTAVADPDALAAELGSRVEEAAKRLEQTAAETIDDQARAPSQLPDWSRGHVLTHLARNADGLRNLLVWARTGVETPQYPSVQARNDGIEAGAGRRAAELAADIAESAAQFAAEAARLSGADWTVQVAGVRGSGHPAWFTLWRRLSEVEIHHVDLGLGYRPADWPEQFSSQCLDLVADRFSGPDCVAALLVSTDDGAEYRIGPPGQPATVTVTGQTRELLAWLIGRAAGNRLITEPAGPLPPVPPW